MYKHFQLDNGIRIVMEKIPHFRSVSIGLWFQAGSVYERPEENGLSHFIEHMMFKGTNNRNARQIAEEMDSIGGQLNAFTAKEYSCFYCKVIGEHIEHGISLLSDMVLNSQFEETELEKEKGVILEEIDMYEDSPEDLVHELLSKAFFGDHPLAAPILGSAELLSSYSRSDLIEFKEKFYTTDNLVIAAAGNFQEDQLLSLIESYFVNWQQRGNIPQEEKSPSNELQILYARKEIEQSHLSLSFPGIPSGHTDNYPSLIMNNMFGGSMSSRLFQKIREDRGLAYSVFSYPSNYRCAGMFSVYAGMKPSQCESVLKLIIEEVGLLREKGFSDEEFHMAREQLKGNYILGIESTGSRMNAIGRSLLMKEKVLTPSEVIDKIDHVQPEDVRRVTRHIFQSGQICGAFVGNEDQTEKIRNIITWGV